MSLSLNELNQWHSPRILYLVTERHLCEFLPWFPNKCLLPAYVTSRTYHCYILKPEGLKLVGPLIGRLSDLSQQPQALDQGQGMLTQWSNGDYIPANSVEGTTYTLYQSYTPNTKVIHNKYNSLRPSDTYMHASVNSPSLVQIMACRLDGAKPLTKPILEYH